MTDLREKKPYQAKTSFALGENVVTQYINQELLYFTSAVTFTASKHFLYPASSYKRFCNIEGSLVHGILNNTWEFPHWFLQKQQSKHHSSLIQ